VNQWQPNPAHHHLWLRQRRAAERRHPRAGWRHAGEYHLRAG